MKKKRIRFIGIALILALVAVLVFSTGAFAGEGYWECWEEEGYLDAWEEEGYLDAWGEEGYWNPTPEVGHNDCWDEVGHNQLDTLIRDSSSFVNAQGYSNGVRAEFHKGGKVWSGYDEHYDVYQDDGSGKGWLDRVEVCDRSFYPTLYTNYYGADAFYFDKEPGTYYVMDEPGGCIWVVDVEAGQEWIITKLAGEEWIVTTEAGEKWIVTKAGGCVWIPATKTKTNGIPDVDLIKIMLPNGSTYARYCGHSFEKAVDFNDGTWRIQMSKSVRIYSSSGQKPSSLRVGEDGEITSKANFKGDVPVITRM